MLYLNFATGFVFPPYWLNHPVTVIDRHNQYSAIGEGMSLPSQEEAMGNLYQCPLRLKLKSEPESEWWTLPFDPVMSVSGGNNIVRSNVLKQDNSNNERRGTIKEVWSQDDYTIQIAGLFMGKNDDDIPMDELGKLRNICEARQVIEVECDLLEIFNIHYIATEKFEFAHTNGRQNQQFSITAYSDDDFSLLVK